MTLPHWEDFWRSGALVSCPTDSAEGFSGSLRAVWEQFFAALPDGARILDVGTGNGALPMIAVATARRRSVRFDVHGVDLARIDPRRVVRDGARLFDGVVFHGGFAAEALPFADGSFDAVVGQYSLEYTRREQTLREVRRVAKTGAPARFVLHHAASVVVTLARESLLHARELEERAQAFDDLRAYVAAERADAAQAAALHARITARMRDLHALAATSKGSSLLADVLPALGRLFELRQQLAPDDFARAFDSAYRSFKALERRLSELVDAALDEAAMRALADLARASGFDAVRHAPLVQDGAFLVGWQLDMQAGSGVPRA